MSVAEAVIETVDFLVTVVLFKGEMMEVVGGVISLVVLSTVTLMIEEEPMFPAASYALVCKVWTALEDCVVSQVNS